VRLLFHERATAAKAVALFLVLVFEASLACAAAAAAPQTDDQQDPEVQLGQEVFDELKAKGQIVASSPLYGQLEPIAARITKAAQPSYPHPFRFYLVHQTQPNAFSTPGGNVYVADSLLYFVKNTEELAGTLCHEVSHTIHHDAMVLAERRQRIALREAGADVILGPTPVHILAVALLGKLNSLGYSREEESRADVTGSDICASAQYNPWGLVWLFTDFDNAKMGGVPELLSDHPGNAHRVATLKEHYRRNPETFARFDPDRGSATPLHVPAQMAETFVQ
jgi:predicted Zn-dependent protease